MRLLYIARMGNHDNADEDSIAYAFKILGHEVLCVDEAAASVLKESDIRAYEVDFCLIHKWGNFDTLKTISRVCPVVFWYFDMVCPIDGDITLRARSEYRIEWMNEVLKVVTVGFCTDGDWVTYINYREGEEKLVHLMQGMDERMVGMGDPVIEGVPPILFMGMVNHGRKRAGHILELQTRYKDKFMVFGNAGPRRRVHGRELANLLASTKIVVSPDGPNTPNYWSNRVYLTLGLGGFLLHPHIKKLEKHYRLGEELVMYHDRDDLNNLIDYYLNVDDTSRMEVRERGLKATVERNLYRHRCSELVREVRRRM